MITVKLLDELEKVYINSIIYFFFTKFILKVLNLFCIDSKISVFNCSIHTKHKRILFNSTYFNVFARTITFRYKYINNSFLYVSILKVPYLIYTQYLTRSSTPNTNEPCSPPPTLMPPPYQLGNEGQRKFAAASLLSAGRIPKADPMEGQLQDMLHFNMERCAGKQTF